MPANPMRLCASVLLALVAATPAAAEPTALSYSREQAAARVAQLSPGSGVVPGYARQHLTAYRAGQVVFNGNVPVGVLATDGTIRPLGGYSEARRYYAAPAVREAPAAVRQAPPSHAVLAVAPRRTDAVYADRIDPAFLPQVVAYEGGHGAGTIVIDTRTKFLYLIETGGKARRYGVGVGKEGFGWRGTETVTRKAEWPGWTPPREMIARERAKGRVLPAHMAGGPENPLGARALYLGSTLYRIHGTNQPWTVGQAVSSGCIRMRNEDVIDLYERTRVGARVVVM